MKKLFSCLAFLGFAIGALRADSTTTNMGLTLPSLSANDKWGGKVNSNFQTIDSSAANKNLTNTFVQDQTMLANVILSSTGFRVNDASTHYLQFKGSQTITTTNFTLPAADGRANQPMTTDGLGALRLSDTVSVSSSTANYVTIQSSTSYQRSAVFNYSNGTGEDTRWITNFYSTPPPFGVTPGTLQIVVSSEPANSAPSASLFGVRTFSYLNLIPPSATGQPGEFIIYPSSNAFQGAFIFDGTGMQGSSTAGLYQYLVPTSLGWSMGGVSANNRYDLIASSNPTSTANFHVAVSTSGHFITSGSRPTLSSCGTGSPSVTGDDNQGTITLGAGSPTACTLTFANAWGATPTCTTDEDTTSLTHYISAISQTAFTVTLSATATKIFYRCGCSGIGCR